MRDIGRLRSPIGIGKRAPVNPNHIAERGASSSSKCSPANRRNTNKLCVSRIATASIAINSYRNLLLKTQSRSFLPIDEKTKAEIRKCVRAVVVLCQLRAKCLSLRNNSLAVSQYAKTNVAMPCLRLAVATVYCLGASRFNWAKVLYTRTDMAVGEIGLVMQQVEHNRVMQRIAKKYEFIFGE